MRSPLLRIVATWLLALMLASPARAEEDEDPPRPPGLRGPPRALLVLGQVSGGVVGAGVGYGTGMFARFGLTTCSDPMGCEGFDEAIQGAFIWGPAGAVAGAVGGVLSVRSAQRGADLPVLAGTLGAVAVGSGLVYASIANDQGGSAPLALGGAVVTLVGAPVAAHFIGAATEQPVYFSPVGPRGLPGVSIAARW
jgi:hypothetical protein